MNLTFLCLWDFILFVQYKSKQNKLKVLLYTDFVFSSVFFGTSCIEYVFSAQLCLSGHNITRANKVVTWHTKILSFLILFKASQSTCKLCFIISTMQCSIACAPRCALNITYLLELVNSWPTDKTFAWLFAA